MVPPKDWINSIEDFVALEIDILILDFRSPFI